jgi:hypothetical protein
MGVSREAVGSQVIKLPTTALRQEGGNGQGTAVWLYDAASSSVKLQPVQIASADGNEAVIAWSATRHAGGGHRRPCADPGQKVTVYRDKYAKPLQGSASNQPKTQAGKAQDAPESGVGQPAVAAEAGK